MAKELAKQYDPKGTEDRIYQEWCLSLIHILRWKGLEPPAF